MKLHNFLTSGAIIATAHDTFLIGHGVQHWQQHPPKDGGGLYFPDFFLHADKPWLIFEHIQEITHEELFKSLPSTPPARLLQWESPFQPHFRNVFCDLKYGFNQGHLEKAVPYVLEIAEGTMCQERLSYSLRHLLVHANSNLFVYGFWNEHEGLLGATPEILFRQTEHNTIETVACAGTVPLSDCLVSDPKLLREHQIVVSGIQQSLSSLAKVHVGQQTTIQLHNFAHLLTPIQATLNHEFDFHAIVEALHPTPALGTFPKSNGRHWLEDYQQSVNRGRYGAPVGYQTQNTSTCYVAIRNVQWDTHRFAIGAGCGIVAESEYDKEWQEIQLKLQSIKELLAL